MKAVHTIPALISVLLSKGCITTQESHEAVHNSGHIPDIESQLNSRDDREQEEILRGPKRNTVFIIGN